MKKGLIFVLCFSVLALILVFGCSKTNPTEPDAQSTPTNTATVTAVPTSTPAASPNLSGTITFLAEAIGKQFAVVADTDSNTANGNTAVLYGTADALTEDYAFELPAGNYYVYAFVDMNGSGLTGPGGFDYVGSYNSWSQVATGSTGMDFNCDEKISPVITVNLTLPADAAGRSYFVALLNGNTLDVIGDKPIGELSGIAPAGTQFSVSFSSEPDAGVPYYLIAFLDANGNGGSEGAFPDEGDYIKVYGGTGQNWPASKNFTITGDHTVNMTLVTVTSNVSGTATFPSAANNKMYTVFISNMPLNQEGAQGMFMLTKTAQAGAGSTLNYSAYVPFPGNYYITLMVDMDDSGWNNPGSGPVSTGDFAGIYGVTPPIVNWMSPFPALPNAVIPGTGRNILCTTVPDMSQPYEPPTPAPTPNATVVGEGSVSGTITIPAGQSGKGLNVMVDVDLNPTNNNFVGMYQVTLGSETSLAYTINNVPAGTYYIFAGATLNGPPLAGDAAGVYGTAYPVFPSSPNAVVTSGGTLTANITMSVAAANLSGRVYMPAAVPAGRGWGVLVDYDTDGGNDNHIAMAVGAISTSQTYFDYSLPVALPGTYYVYAVVDSAEPADLFTNGPSCNDYIGFYSMPMPVYFSPAVNNTNININTYENDDGCNP